MSIRVVGESVQMRNLREVYALSSVLQVGIRTSSSLCTLSLCDYAEHSEVHDIHPRHAFLEMKAKTTSQISSRSETTSDDASGVTSDDDVDEPCQQPHPSASISAHTLCF